MRNIKTLQGQGRLLLSVCLENRHSSYCRAPGIADGTTKQPQDQQQPGNPWGLWAAADIGL